MIPHGVITTLTELCEGGAGMHQHSVRVLGRCVTATTHILLVGPDFST